jgi:hypothetical protein
MPLARVGLGSRQLGHVGRQRAARTQNYRTTDAILSLPLKSTEDSEGITQRLEVLFYLRLPLVSRYIHSHVREQRF